jgi:prefoldin subunit 5
MMDFEWKIRMLEKELAHYREMQELMRSRLDTHDNGIQVIVDTLASVAKSQDRAAKTQEQTNETMNTLAGDLKILSETVSVLAQKVSGLIDALGASSNGKP